MSEHEISSYDNPKYDQVSDVYDCICTMQDCLDDIEEQMAAEYLDEEGKQNLCTYDIRWLWKNFKEIYTECNELMMDKQILENEDILGQLKDQAVEMITEMGLTQQEITDLLPEEKEEEAVDRLIVYFSLISGGVYEMSVLRKR